MRKQYAVYWGSPRPDGFGHYAFDTPVEIRCRWTSIIKEFSTASGEKQLSMAVVYPDRVLDINGFLFLGRLKNLENPDLNPELISDTRKIMRIDRNPDFNDFETLITVYVV